MTLTDVSRPAEGTAVHTTLPIGTSLADLARLTAAFTLFLNNHPDLPDLHAVTVEYNPATVSWALDLLTADFDTAGHAAVDIWAKALGASAGLSSEPADDCGNYAAETTLIGFPIRVWSTCLTRSGPTA